MQATINPGYIHGTIKAPASKSMMQRVCAAALLHKGKTTIHNAGASDDDKAALQIIQQLGATVTYISPDVIEVLGGNVMPVNGYIDCGESGLSTRLFTPIAALATQQITITGNGSLLQRPMDAFRDIFGKLNVSLSDFSGNIPFTVKGPIVPADIKVNGADSSQYLSGLLFAFAYAATEKVTIYVTDLKSKPYIDLTLDILKHFRKPVEHKNYCEFYIDPSLFVHTNDVDITIEGDWSSAAVWMVAAAIGGDITVTGLNTDTRQADRGILLALKYAGANVMVNNENVTVNRTKLCGFEYDATHSPDLFPVLSVLAAYSREETLITGVHRLWHEESNRAESITEMLHQMDVPYSIEEDDMCITGRGECDGGLVDSYNDHRIVMAAAIAAIRANAPITIVGAGAVNKSYPAFFNDLASLGIDCTFNND